MNSDQGVGVGALLFIGAVMAGCADSENGGYLTELRVRINQADSGFVVASEQEYVGSPPQVRWFTGSLRGNGALGMPVDAALGESEEKSVFVLDERLYSLGFYRAGNLHQRVGSEGPGPKEFTNPKTVATKSPGQIVVLDAPQELQFYRIVDGRLKFERTARLHKLSAKDMCWTEDGAIVLGTWGSSNKWFHRFTRQGRYLGSFGELLSGKKRGLAETFRRGSIACDRTGELVVFQPLWLPYVFGFERNGDIRWVVEFAEYEAARIHLTESGSIRYDLYNDMKRKFYHVGGNVFVENERVVVQVQKMSLSSNAKDLPFDQIRTYALEVDDGSFIGELRVERTILTMKKERIVLLELVPFPRIALGAHRWGASTTRLQREPSKTLLPAGAGAFRAAAWGGLSGAQIAW